MFADLKYALRQLIKAPGFFVLAVLTLAIGVGENTAIFSVVNAVVFQPLPYRESDRLVRVYLMSHPGVYYPRSYGAVFRDWQDQSTLLESLAAYHNVDKNLTDSGDPVRISGMEVTGDYLRVLGVAPFLGRDFLPEEDAPGGNAKVVILSYEIWQTRFNANRAVIGQIIHLNGDSFTLIGVLPPRALFGSRAAFLTPANIRGDSHKASYNNNDYVVAVIGRLKPGSTMAQVGEELTAGKKTINTRYPVFQQPWTVGVRSLHEAMFGNMRIYVFTLFGGVGIVLLIACANIANLLLSRATGRQSEIAIRIALGATPARIARQLLTESLLVAFIGGAVGLVIGKLSIQPLIVLSGIDTTTAATIGINGRVLLFTLCSACATGLLFGMFPVLSALRTDVNENLKEGVRGSTVGPRRRLQALLLISETALTVILLSCAGLFLRSFINALNADPGFNRKNVLVFELTIPENKSPDPAYYVRLGQQIRERIAHIPGVEMTALATSVPENGKQTHALGDSVSREDRPETRNDMGSGFDAVAGDYFQTLEIPLIRGRLFTEAENQRGAAKVLIVNDRLAHTLFGEDNPLGQYLHFQNDAWQIIGVVGNVRRYQLDWDPTLILYIPQVYYPWRMTVMVRTKGALLALAPEIRSAIRTIDPDLPIANLTTLETLVNDTLQVRQTMFVLLGVFALTALGLACVGVYGVTNYLVAQRTREIAIRIALGAQASRVVALVLRQGLSVVLVGVVIGVIGSLGTGVIIAKQLYGMSTRDSLVMTLVTFVLLSVATLAMWIPARRASRADPMIALRGE